MGLTTPESTFDSKIHVEARLHRLRNLQKHFDIQTLRNGRVLEIGCGIGRFGAFFEEAGCRVVSIDTRQQHIDVLRQYYPGREAAVVDFERWDPALLGKFDAALCFDALNRLSAAEAFLADCTRTADIILLDCTVLDWPWPRCVRESCIDPAGLPYIGCWPSPSWVTTLMERHGFSAEDISSSLANWDGEFPAVYDWEPRHDGEWRHGNTFLRKMWVCRKRSASTPLPRVEQNPASAGRPWAGAGNGNGHFLPGLLATLGRTDLRGLRILDVSGDCAHSASALSDAGAAVIPLVLPDEDIDSPLVSANPDSIDLVVVHGNPGRRRGLTSLLHRLTIAPLLCVELPPHGDSATEDVLQALDRAGYALVPGKHGGNGDGLPALRAFRLRQQSRTVLQPLLVHVHIHKCAGTSLNRLLATSFGSRHCDHYPTCLEPFPTRDELLEFVAGKPDMVSLSSHSFRLYPPAIGNRLPLYVAFLREPLRRFISHLTYAKKQFSTFPDWLKQQWPRNCPEMPLRDMAAWMFEHQSEAVRSGSLVTNFLAEQTWLDIVGGSLKLTDRWLGRDSFVYRGFEPVKLDLAAAVLENFFFVGLVEEMTASVRLLRQELRSYGIHLIEQPLPVENVSRELATEIEWLNPADSVGKAVFRFLDPEIALYRRFEERIRARLSELETEPNPEALSVFR